MFGRRGLIVLGVLLCGCAATAEPATTSSSTAPPSTVAVAPTSSTESESSTTPVPTSSTTTTTEPRPLRYVFPFTGKKVGYGRRHHDYPATDVFGCGATIVAPIGGRIDQTRTFDPWDPHVNDPATRGGKYVSLIGDDGVRYYFAHLASVAVSPGDVVDGGSALGVMGQTGDARNSVCHTHVGISWPCPQNEWEVRRGEIWPWKYLDAWRNGEQLSPVTEVTEAEKAHPDACALAGLAPSAGDA